jgi:hypothetical protein
MSKTGEGDQLPPPKFDEDDITIVVDEDSKSGASNQPSIEDLMKKLDKLMAENKKLRAKSKKGMTHSSSSKDDNSKEEVTRKGGGGESMISFLTTLCLSITIPCHLPPLILPYPLAKLHILRGQTITNGSIARKITYTLFYPRYRKLFVVA